MLLGLILAAGQGKRYGAPKVTAQSGAWLRSCINALQDGGCDEIRVLLGAALVEPPIPASAIIVPDYQEGLSRTLLAGIQFARTAQATAVVIIPVDMPDITAEVVRRLLQAIPPDEFISKSCLVDYAHALARVVCGTHPRHPVLIGSAFFLELEEYLVQAEGIKQDEGAKGFLQQYLPQLLCVECGDLMSGQDYDYPESLA